MKRKVFLGILALCVLSIVLYLALELSKDKIQNKFGNEIQYGLKSENNKFIDSIGLKQFKLKLQPKDQDHFQNLRELIYNQDFDNYQTSNTWKNATLEYDSKTTYIQIKIHGRTPANHTFKEFISYRVKSPVNINGLKEFNLIIYERIGSNSDRIQMLAKEFDLIVQQDELIQLKINDSENHLYYFETPTKNDFLKQYNLINYELKDLKSPIVTSNFNSNTIDSLLSNKDIPDKARTFYLELNQVIENENHNEIHNYFDIEYISRFQLARAYAGLTNHGFSSENLLIALDTSKMKLYPILHRDNYFGRFDKDNFNKKEDGSEIQILQLLSKNVQISNEIAKYRATNTIKSIEINSYKTEIDRFHNQLYK